VQRIAFEIVKPASGVVFWGRQLMPAMVARFAAPGTPRGLVAIVVRCCRSLRYI
jgi:hypothetical protein